MTAGIRRPTATDVAHRAGVSQAVVSYVLNGRSGGDDRISDDTRRRVLAAVEELGYVPNRTARILRNQRTERVCLVLPRLGAPYNDILAQELQRACQLHGYVMIIAVTGELDGEKRVLQEIRRGLADGVVFQPRYQGDTDVALVEELARSGVALVAISNELRPASYDVFRTTDRAGCYEATNHLLARGHRRIGFLSFTSSGSSNYARLEAYEQALMEHGLGLQVELMRSGAETRWTAYRSACELFSLPDRPTAILSSSDPAAIGAMYAARDAGLRVPEDVAVIGVGNIPEGADTQPALTTVGPDPQDWSPVTDLLFSRLNATGPMPGRFYTQPWRLIVRNSA